MARGGRRAVQAQTKARVSGTEEARQHFSTPGHTARGPPASSDGGIWLKPRPWGSPA